MRPGAADMATCVEFDAADDVDDADNGRAGREFDQERRMPLLVTPPPPPAPTPTPTPRRLPPPVPPPPFAGGGSCSRSRSASRIAARGSHLSPASFAATPSAVGILCAFPIMRWTKSTAAGCARRKLSTSEISLIWAPPCFARMMCGSIVPNAAMRAWKPATLASFCDEICAINRSLQDSIVFTSFNTSSGNRNRTYFGEGHWCVRLVCVCVEHTSLNLICVNILINVTA